MIKENILRRILYAGAGLVITSGVCPWIAKETGYPDGTPKLTQKLIDTIKAKAK